MDRKIKLATAVSLVALSTAACAPNPYYYNTTGNVATTTTGGATAGGVTHSHDGRTHTHALPPQGINHTHQTGTVAGNVQRTNTAGVAHSHDGRVHVHALPPEGYQHVHTINNAYQQPTTNTQVATTTRTTTGGVTHSHDGRTHTHALPAEGINHTHNTGGAVQPRTTQPQTQPQTQTYSYPAQPAQPAQSGSTSYDYTAGSYYDYSAPKGNGNTYRAVPPAPTTDNAGGTYVVQNGDTVFQVMRKTGVYWKSIIRLNNLQGPDYVISPGQRLRLR